MKTLVRVRNRPGYPSSNPERDSISHSAKTLWKCMNPRIPFSVRNKGTDLAL